ncbi:MAG TPA: WYL domain-containing protein [Nocardioidaceae bacterium]|nr:WYL domain-containing protein [Nocardioidaceae bacterium]
MTSAKTGAKDQMRRLLALVPYLQTRDAVSIKQVAADFGVSEARIRSDLKVLWFCGLPGLGMGDLIDIDMDALDGEEVIRLSNAEYLTRPLRLDSTEASALMVALRTLREGSTDDERPIVDRVLGKIEAAADESIAEQVEVLLPRTLARIQSLKATLEGAIAQGRQVRLVYYVPSRDEATDRVVDPLAVGSQDGWVYLDAWCHQADDQRLFRIDRISQAEVLSSEAVDHPDVRPRDLSDGIFQASEEDTLVVLSLSPGARWVAEYYPVESAVDEPDGSMTVRMRVGDPAWLTRLMLRLGGRATVLSPAGVGEAARATATRALANYLQPSA